MQETVERKFAEWEKRNPGGSPNDFFTQPEFRTIESATKDPNE
ncbi:hypothetical protein BZB76_1915 [Actinomadura pelletieri DSM 43383]|uniref:Uncharacterized protein n=1 Tax=Actinomadura pelletieri DSM 43383 TaxID=1120940 RepID=A0A495QSS5_9ACTN|nr:hypothetical protein BZB76_1915 [Actinomadura pelletieri DSM 43383]